MSKSLTDYLPIAQRYLAHWELAEAELKSVIVLGEGSTIDTLRDLHEALAEALQDTQQASGSMRAVASDRDSARLKALPIASQVRKAILGRLPQSAEAAQLPACLPAVTGDVQKQLAALQLVQEVWTAVNALPPHQYPGFTPPLVVRVLQDGATITVTLAEFTGLYATLGQAAEAMQGAHVRLVKATAARNTVIKRLVKLLDAYSKVIKGTFPLGSDILLSLPKRS